jgi:hypothetical protein
MWQVQHDQSICWSKSTLIPTNRVGSQNFWWRGDRFCCSHFWRWAFENSMVTVNESILISLSPKQTSNANLDMISPRWSQHNQSIHWSESTLILAYRVGSDKLLWWDDKIWLDSLLEIGRWKYNFDGYKSTLIPVTPDRPAIFDIDVTIPLWNQHNQSICWNKSTLILTNQFGSRNLWGHTMVPLLSIGIQK